MRSGFCVLRFGSATPLSEVVQIGPFAMATDRLLAVAAIWLFVALLPWLLRRDDARAARIVWLALAAGLIASRLVYVVQHWSVFSEDPVSMAYLWQGGFSAMSGVLAAAAVLAIGLRPLAAKGKAIAVLAVIFGLWIAITQIGTRPPPMLASGLTATGLDGRPISLDAMRGRPFVLNLWATWCPPCRREMPMLAAAAKEAESPPIVFVNQGETQAAIRSFLADEGLQLANHVIDRSGQIARATGSSALPTTLFVDAEGRVRVSHFGEISRAALADGLDVIKEKD